MHFQDSDIQKLLIQVNCLALQYLHGVMKLIPDYLYNSYTCCGNGGSLTLKEVH